MTDFYMEHADQMRVLERLNLAVVWETRGVMVEIVIRPYDYKKKDYLPGKIRKTGICVKQSEIGTEKFSQKLHEVRKKIIDHIERKKNNY